MSGVTCEWYVYSLAHPQRAVSVAFDRDVDALERLTEMANAGHKGLWIMQVSTLDVDDPQQRGPHQRLITVREYKELARVLADVVWGRAARALHEAEPILPPVATT